MKPRSVGFFVGCVAALLLSSLAHAVVSNPLPRTILQPDGKKIQVVRRGDERGSWLETSAGYTIAKARNGYWYYVRGYEKGKAILSKRRAHLPVDSGLKLVQHLNPWIDRDREPPWFETEPFDDSELLAGPHSGDVVLILVEFDDRAFTHSSASGWADLIEDTQDPDAKTIAHYYDAASYGKVSLAPASESYGVHDDGVIGPLHLPMNHPNTGPTGDPTGGNAAHSDIYEMAIDLADPYIDFASYDTNSDPGVDPSELAIVIVVAGYEHASTDAHFPSVHGHASHGSGVLFTDDPDPVFGGTIPLFYQYAMVGELHEQTGVANQFVPANLGIFVHELGHLIYKLPDLYDTDFSSVGIGPYGVMGYGAWGMDPAGDTQLGQTPTLPSAWSQFKLGWVGASANFPFTGLVTSGRSTTPLSQHLVGIAHMAIQSPQGFISCSNEEYFLMQYRTAEGYDRGLTPLYDAFTGAEQPGVVIYHVDERRADNTSDAARLVDAEEANNLSMDLAGSTHYNLFYLGNVTNFDEFTTPGSAFNGGADSGVYVSVGGPQVTFQGDNAIAININTDCDASTWTPKAGGIIQVP